MKKVIFLLPVIFINIIILYSQSPQAFKYQAVARDNSGNILVNEELDVRISIISDSINGNTDYNEVHTVTTNDYGSFALQIGTGNVQFGDFSSISWGAGNKFVKVEAKKSSDLNYEELATSQLLSVPYALYAENAASSVWNKNGDDINYLDGNVGIGTVSQGFDLHIVGSQTYPEIRLVRDQGSGVDYAAKMTVGENNGAVFGTDMNHSVHLFTNNTPRLTISGDGKVGIGTDSPGEKLHIGGDIRVGLLTDDDGSTSGYGNFLYFSGGDDWVSYDSDNSDPLWIARYNIADNESELRVNIGDDNGGDDAFVIGNDTWGWDRFVVKLIGNVGIGTTNPQGKIHVQGGSTGSADSSFVVLENGNVGIGTTSPEARLKVRAPTTGSFNTFLKGVSNDGTKDIDFNIQNDGTANFGAGFTNFGIGTVSPTEKLEVAGTVKATAFTGGSINSDNLYVTGEIFTEVLEVSHLGGIKSGGAIRFYADTDANGDDDFIWYDNTNSEVFKIATDGNVGVGLSNPGGKLHVNGEIIIGGGGTNVGGCMIYDTSTSPGSIKYYDDKTSTWYILNESGITYTGTLWNQNGSNLYYNSGSVGIGTMNPRYILDVQGNMGIGTASDPNNAQVSISDEGDYAQIQSWNGNLEINPQGNEVYFVSGSESNVGIGTNSPSNRLQVAGDVRIGLLTEDNGSTAGYGNRLYFSGGDDWSIGDSDNSDALWIARYNIADNSSELRVNIGDDDGGDDAFIIGNDTWGWDNLVVKNNGNVGIGTTNPQATLDINGNLRISAQVTINASEYDPLYFLGDSNNDWFIGPNVGSGSGFGIHDVTSNATRIKINTSGNVGIGTSDPGATLTVNGFTQLGGTGADVPKIKTKIITGTLDGNALEDIPTGLSEASFLDFEMTVDYGGYGYRRSGYNGDGADGFFEIKTVGDNIRVTSKGSGIINQPYKLFIIYQE